MALIRMDIQTVVVGGGNITSLVILRTRADGRDVQLPIRIGTVEATAISMGVNGAPAKRPLTHDLLLSTIKALGAQVESITIAKVEGTTFYARITLRLPDESVRNIDARPSDAIALAVRAGAPIFATEDVVDSRGGGAPALARGVPLVRGEPLPRRLRGIRRVAFPSAAVGVVKKSAPN